LTVVQVFAKYSQLEDIPAGSFDTYTYTGLRIGYGRPLECQLVQELAAQIYYNALIKRPIFKEPH
jgi:hypothetical protein